MPLMPLITEAETWLKDHFGGFEEFAKEHAQIALAGATRILAEAQRGLAVAQAVAALAGPQAQALVKEAEQGVASAQKGIEDADAFLARVLGTPAAPA